MSTWPDDLTLFADAIRGLGVLPDDKTTCPNYPASTAIDIYRNNYLGNLQGTLAATYPVIEQIVGKEFFRMMMHKFIEIYPSHSGNLHFYGAELGDFVRSFEPARGLAYLADVARLEWVWHRAYFAPDSDAFDVARLASVSAEQYEHLHLLIQPACQVIRSRYPVATIWHAHQPGMSDEFHIDLDSGAENALVSRNDDVVQVNVLSVADADWLERIQAGMPLGDATAATLEQHASFDLQSTLLKLVEQSIVIDIEL